MSLDLVKQMFSIPPEKPLTTTQRFTFWSAFLAYFVGGLSIILAPDLWNIILGFDLESVRGRGYFLLMGGGLMIIGFCFIVLSRHISSQVPRHAVILGTVLSRLILVNGKLFTLYNKGMITLAFALLFSALDTCLSLITYAIWSREIQGASLKRFFSEVWAVANSCPNSQKSPVYMISQLMGYFQFIFGLAIAPSFLQSRGIVPKETFETQDGGLLLGFLTMLAIHGWFHALSSGASNHSFLMASLFYRVVWNIPYFLFLGFTSKIEIGLSKVLVSFDVVYSLIILVLLLIEVPRMKKN